MTEESDAAHGAVADRPVSDTSWPPPDVETAQAPFRGYNASGSLPALFFFDGLLDAAIFDGRALAACLESNRPVYVLGMPGTSGIPFRETLETTATLYLDLIQSLRPHGPYVLSGHRGGALLAHEVARQLQRKHERVLKIVAVDGAYANAQLAGAATSIERFLRAAFVGSARRAAVRRSLGRFGTSMRESRPSHDTPARVRLAWRSLNGSSHGMPAQESATRGAVWQSLAADYIPGRFFGTIDLIVGADVSESAALARAAVREVSGRVAVETANLTRPSGTTDVEALGRAVLQRLQRI